jgi:hypothetical protein
MKVKSLVMCLLIVGLFVSVSLADVTILETVSGTIDNTLASPTESDSIMSGTGLLNRGYYGSSGDGRMQWRGPNGVNRMSNCVVGHADIAWYVTFTDDGGTSYNVLNPPSLPSVTMTLDCTTTGVLNVSADANIFDGSNTFRGLIRDGAGDWYASEEFTGVEDPSIDLPTTDWYILTNSAVYDSNLSGAPLAAPSPSGTVGSPDLAGVSGMGIWRTSTSVFPNQNIQDISLTGGVDNTRVEDWRLF